MKKTHHFMLFFSPLEQFTIISLIPMHIGNFYFSFTNSYTISTNDCQGVGINVPPRTVTSIHKSIKSPVDKHIKSDELVNGK